MSIARRSSEVARHLFAMGEGKLAWGRGVRTAFALIVPVLAGDLLHLPYFSWAALGGWLGSLADKGGSYRARATTMAALGILGAACAFGGTGFAGSAPLAIITMLVVGIIGGLGRVYGDEGSTVGLFVAVIYAVAVGTPSALPHVELQRAGMFALGVVWSMVLSLLLWPLHPFRPARRAVAGSYRALAEFAESLALVATAIGDQGAGDARARARASHAAIRSALENARVVIAGMRRPKQGPSPRGEQLVVLTEGAEQLFGTLVAIDAELEAAHESGADAADDAFARAFACLAKTLELLTAAIDDSVDVRKRAPLAAPTLTDLAVRTDWPNVHVRAAAQLLRRLASDLHVLIDTAGKLGQRASSVMPTTAEHRAALPAVPHDRLEWLRPLREALTPRSLPARHALRMGVASAAAVWLSFALDITRGYWATITTLIVLQPYAGATIRKTLQRVGGSVVGGLIAAAVAVVARTKLAIAGVMVPFTIGAVAVLPLNYGVFVLLLTPVFVLLAEPHPGDWGIAGLRVVNTLLGGVIALAAAQILWPTHELETYPRQLASLLRKLRELFTAAVSDGDEAAAAWRGAVDDARRQFGVAVTNAEATMQRLITEEAPNPYRVEAAMTLLIYGRRMASTLSAIAEARANGDAAPSAAVTKTLGAELDSLAAALDGAAPPPASPSIAGSDATAPEIALDDVQGIPASLQRSQLNRVRAQLAVMRSAVSRYLAA